MTCSQPCTWSFLSRTVVSYKHTWLTGNRFSGNTCNKVFCGWDFCVQDPQAALLKHSFIRNELKMDLEEQRFRLRVSQRTLQQRVLLYLLRAAVNSLVLLLLCGSFVLIYYASETATSPLEQVRGLGFCLQ
ncbi:hypothetical protein NFI96_005685 [Prochilodus magdalenae]|nr:hypothetical protein NFI96_005685 [Prochilodus magdalenae]